jgi:ATP-dependent DNA ligase
VPVETPADPLEWRPQLPRDRLRPSQIVDPIVEPHWRGRHVLVHFDLERPTHDDGPWLRLIDIDGEEATDAEPAVVAELIGAILARDAVLDGFLTDQATRSGQGASLAGRVIVPRFSVLLGRGAEVDVRPLPEDAAGGPIAFVAVDLLRLDGQALLDLPLLERKRLLDSLVRQGPLVRVSPFTRPPLRPWLQSWKSAGFDGALVKAANSRYVPSTVSQEWTVVTKLSAL